MELSTAVAALSMSILRCLISLEHNFPTAVAAKDESDSSKHVTIGEKTSQNQPQSI